MVEKAFVRGDLDTEDVSAAGGVIGIEKCENFLSFEEADLGDREAGEIDRDLERREENVAGDRARVGAGGTPGARLLRGGTNGRGEDDGESGDEWQTKAHRLRMTSGGNAGKRGADDRLGATV